MNRGGVPFQHMWKGRYSSCCPEKKGGRSYPNIAGWQKNAPPNDAKNVRPMNITQADYVGWSMGQYVKVSPKKTGRKR